MDSGLIEMLRKTMQVTEPSKLMALYDHLGLLDTHYRKLLDSVEDVRKLIWYRSQLPHSFDSSVSPSIKYFFNGSRSTLTISADVDNMVEIPWVEWDFAALRPNAISQLREELRHDTFHLRIFRLKSGDNLPPDKKYSRGKNWRYGPERYKLEQRIRQQMGLPLTMEEYNARLP